MRRLDISGMRFGRLTAIKQNGFDVSHSRRHIKWDCLCDCGNMFSARLNSLSSGGLISCGCIKRSATHKITHNMVKTKEYKTWARIKTRCLNSKSKDYHLYGGRGIRICNEWETSFEVFYKDMGPRPDGVISIDRVDTNGNYEKNNCRWADNKTQSRNKRNNKFYEFNGMRMCQSDWAVHLGITVPTLIERLQKWSFVKSLSTFKET